MKTETGQFLRSFRTGGSKNSNDRHAEIAHPGRGYGDRRGENLGRSAPRRPDTEGAHRCHLLLYYADHRL
jgi:hypothetical protein